MLEPVRKKKLYEEIVAQLVENIKKGELVAGDRLPTERDLSEKLGVSRTTIREALRSMESMGYIESKVGGGTYIKALKIDSIRDPLSVLMTQDKKLISELVDVRILLESETAYQAALHATDEQKKEMVCALDMMRDEIRNGKLPIKSDNAFHSVLARAADNSAMTLITELCADLLSKSREAALSIPGQAEVGLRNHEEIYDAICEKNAMKASEAMKKHLRLAQEALARSE